MSCWAVVYIYNYTHNIYIYVDVHVHVHYITLHTWHVHVHVHDMTWHDMTWHYIHTYIIYIYIHIHMSHDIYVPSIYIPMWYPNLAWASSAQRVRSPWRTVMSREVMGSFTCLGTVSEGANVVGDPANPLWNGGWIVGRLGKFGRTVGENSLDLFLFWNFHKMPEIVVCRYAPVWHLPIKLPHSWI